jgi:hypothetical protein
VLFIVLGFSANVNFLRGSSLALLPCAEKPFPPVGVVHSHGNKKYNITWLYGDAVSIETTQRRDGTMINECGAFGGIKIGKQTEVFGVNLPQCHFDHNKFYMT